MFPFSADFLDINRIITTIPGILVALTLHELAHGYSAYLMGDPTAKNHGRLTLNPLPHLDPFGFIMLLIAGFGWAKPVPYDPRYFKRYKLGTFVVAIAGVVTNFILAILFTILLGLYAQVGDNQYIADILLNTIGINLVLGVFNLFPIPPLDGSKVILSFLPRGWEYHYYRIQKYSYGLLFVLLYLDVFDRILSPTVEFLFRFLLNNLLIHFL